MQTMPTLREMAVQHLISMKVTCSQDFFLSRVFSVMLFRALALNCVLCEGIPGSESNGSYLCCQRRRNWYIRSIYVEMLKLLEIWGRRC